MRLSRIEMSEARNLFISMVCLIALFSAAFGGLSESESYETLSSDQIIEAGNDSKQHPSKSLLPLTTKHDAVLVAAPDGTMYLVETNSRKILWSFTSGPSIYSSYQAPPNNEDDEYNASRQSSDFFIDCGEDWELYVHRSGFREVKLPLGAEEFIRRTPYLSDDGGVMLGCKKTTVFLVDAESGTVIHTYSLNDFLPVSDQNADENLILPGQHLEEQIGSSTLDLEAVDQLLYIVRTDYGLKYTSGKTGKVLWYLKFSDFDASFKCPGIVNSFGGVSFNGENFSPEHERIMELPLRCRRRPVVYRIHHRSSLDSIFASGKIPNVLPGGGVLSLPASDFNPLLKPVGKLLGPYQGIEGEIVLALPPHKPENFGIMSLPGGDTEASNTGIAPENLEEANLWSSVLFVALRLLVVAVLFYVGQLAVRKQGKSNKQAEYVEVVMSKKKKARRSGFNKTRTSTEKKQKNVSLDFMMVHNSGFPRIGRNEGNLQLTFPNPSNGLINGRKIGKLFVSNKEIAKGSNGTIVLEGNYDGRAVAVKRLVQTHHDVAVKEIQNLIASDQHPNIVRWYGVEYDQDFVYLSLERCTCSLYELVSSYSSSSDQVATQGQDPKYLNDCNIQLQWVIENNKEFELWKANGYPSPQLLNLIRDIVSGLAHLHELGIIHRDLKPQNVLILKERSLCAKISDMGISKRLARDMSSLTKGATGEYLLLTPLICFKYLKGYGSSGWQAPEQLRHERQTRAVDLFSLGCVIFFCITGGKHPFGESLECDINIVNNRKDLFLVESIPEVLDLISHLLDPNPDLRPKAVDVLCHPFFWSPEMRLSFLRDASDRVELEDREDESELLEALEGIGTVALGGRWDEKMESAFINDIGRYRRYKFHSVRDLLRVIRNKLNHYRELPKEIQAILGPVPEGFENYFSIRFPKLLIEVYKVLKHYCGEEEFLRLYFKSNQIYVS